MKRVIFITAALLVSFMGRPAEAFTVDRGYGLDDMVVGGYCPGTAAAAVATGKIDGIVFIVGFLIGSLVFGDLFSVWGDFYNSDYMGAFRLDQWLGIGLGPMIFGIAVVAVAGSLGMLYVQHRFWPMAGPPPQGELALKLQGTLVAIALLVALIIAFFPTEAFIDDYIEPPYYIVPRG